MSKNNENVFEELRAIAENTLRVYQSGLIHEEERQAEELERQAEELERQAEELKRQAEENERIGNENDRISKDEIRDIKISKIEYLIGEIGEAVDGILAIQANLIGGNL